MKPSTLQTSRRGRACELVDVEVGCVVLVSMMSMFICHDHDHDDDDDQDEAESQLICFCVCMYSITQ